MAAKNKKAKKSQNFSMIFSVLLSLVLVTIIFFGIFALINDPEKPDDNNIASDQTTNDVKDDLKNNTDDDVVAVVPADNDGENTYDDEKVGYESGNNPKDVERDENGKKVASISLKIVQNEQIIILSGSITNFKEEGGNCKYILKQNDVEKSFAKPVIPDAKNTVCEAIKLEKSDIGTGEWSVRMEYKSNTAEGVSEAQTINL